MHGKIRVFQPGPACARRLFDAICTRLRRPSACASPCRLSASSSGCYSGVAHVGTALGVPPRSALLGPRGDLALVGNEERAGNWTPTPDVHLLTPAELQLVLTCRGDGNRCGMALLRKPHPFAGGACGHRHRLGRPAPGSRSGDGLSNFSSWRPPKVNAAACSQTGCSGLAPAPELFPL